MRTATFLLAATLTGLLTGCGGAGPDTPAQGVRAVVVIRWPEPARMVPLLAQSIVLEVVQTGIFSSSQSVGRPAAGGTSEVRLENLPAGALRFTATAYPEPDGQGIAQATATQTLTGAAGDVLEVRLTMASTVTRYELSGSGLTDGAEAGQYSLRITSGSGVDVTVAAYDGDGYQVLVPAATWTVTSGSEYTALAWPTAGQCTVTGTASGRAVVQVVSQQAESGSGQLVCELTVDVVTLPTLTLTPPASPIYPLQTVTVAVSATWDPSRPLSDYNYLRVDRNGDGTDDETIGFVGGDDANGRSEFSIDLSWQPYGSGTYHLKAYFEDGYGQRAQSDTLVTIAAYAQPTLSLTAEPNPVYVKDSITFTASATWDGNLPLTWPATWLTVYLDRDGDGDYDTYGNSSGTGLTSATVSLTPSYNDLGVGTYTAKAWFTDNAGQKAEAQVVVTVAASGVDVTIE